MKRILKKMVAISLMITTMFSSMSISVSAAEVKSKSLVYSSIASAKKATITYDSKIITINGKKYTKKEFEQLLNTAVKVKRSNSGVIKPAVAELVAGTYFIPGVGEVLITATGVIIIGGAVIAAGSWVGKKVTAYFAKQKEISIIESAIPSRLKDKNGNVKIGEFKQKVKGQTAYKEKGGWSIDKDQAGHGGRKWKLKNKSGKRIASLDGNGKVLGD